MAKCCLCEGMELPCSIQNVIDDDNGMCQTFLVLHTSFSLTFITQAAYYGTNEYKA